MIKMWFNYLDFGMIFGIFLRIFLEISEFWFDMNFNVLLKLIWFGDLGEFILLSKLNAAVCFIWSLFNTILLKYINTRLPSIELINNTFCKFLV